MSETTLTIHGIKARPVIVPMKRPISHSHRNHPIGTARAD